MADARCGGIVWAGQIMELYQLRSFIVVAREGNLSRAARVLCASQPAVSAQIKALEDDLGLPLFERTSRGMFLTASGEIMLGKARNVLEAADVLSREARVLRGEPAGVLRLGALVDPSVIRLARILSLLQERLPAVSVDLRHATSGVVREEILAGKLDCGLILGPSEPQLERRDLRPIRLVVILPPGSDADMEWSRIRALQWIGTPPGCPFQMLGRVLFERLGSEPERVFQVEIERTIVEMVAAGLGAALVREDAALRARERGKCEIWTTEYVDTTLTMVWRQGRGADPSVRAVRRIVDEVWDDPE